MTPLAILGLGTWELVAIAGVVFILFGPRLPKAMRGLGRSISELRKGVNEIGLDDDEPQQLRRPRDE